MKTHEQFDKLAEQCYVKTGSVQTDHFDYVKFAKLIVRECADVAKETRWAVPPSQEQIARGIQQHFGVEDLNT